MKVGAALEGERNDPINDEQAAERHAELRAQPTESSTARSAPNYAARGGRVNELAFGTTSWPAPAAGVEGQSASRFPARAARRDARPLSQFPCRGEGWPTAKPRRMGRRGTRVPTPQEKSGTGRILFRLAHGHRPASASPNYAWSACPIPVSALRADPRFPYRGEKRAGRISAGPAPTFGLATPARESSAFFKALPSKSIYEIL